ncbi:MAG: ribonuclease HI family protein [bacterium]|nr:ribonuclease HI family protein [bacterium]
MENSISIFCDGGALGNPGPAASAFTVKGGGEIFYQESKKIGHATNNVAEYKAVIFALLWLKENRQTITKSDKINFFLDSELVVKQLNGLYKIKNESLRILAIKVKRLENEINLKITFTHIKRAKNQTTDTLIKKILNPQKTS